MLVRIPANKIEFAKNLNQMAARISRQFPSLEKNRVYRAVNVIVEGRIISVGNDVWSVKPASGPEDLVYIVEPKSCTCPDCQKGHICKHRIAAFMLAELDKQEARDISEHGLKQYDDNGLVYYELP